MCWLGKRRLEQGVATGHRITPLDNEITPEVVEDDEQVHLDLLRASGRGPRREVPGEARYTNGRWVVEEALPDYDFGLICSVLRVDVCVACWFTLYAEWVDLARNEVDQLEAYYSYLDRMEG